MLIKHIVRSAFHSHAFSHIKFSIRLAHKRPLSTSVQQRTPQPLVGGPNDASLSSYTSGRFLFNEELRMKERYVEFNIEALQRAAENAIANEHGKVTSIRKLAEGGFNRVLLFTMQDGFEMIAKIPYHIAQPCFFATASEAASMTFLRAQGLPVPEVYGYSATAKNPVGTEYLLMVKAPGVSLASRWECLEDRDIKRIAKSFVELEMKLFKFRFSAIGSLYFKTDIPPSS